jgi:thiamine transporter ThiT
VAENALLYLAAVLIFALGVAHSVLGERYILIRLLRRPDLPKLFGSSWFTARTLRFAWHVTSLTWFGMAALLGQLALGTFSPATAACIIGLTCIACGILALAFTRGRHLSWLVFFTIGALALGWSAA